MKADLVIPKGWYRVRRGKVRKEDLYVIWDRVGTGKDPGWAPVDAADFDLEPTPFDVVIRRRPSKKRRTR